MDTKRFFLYFIVIVALALAGCGGGGGGTAMGPDPTPPDPTPTCPEGQVGTPPNCAPPGPTPEEMALKEAQDAAMAAYMMAMGYADSAKDYVAMGNAMKYADMAKGASDMAAAATTSEMAAEYQMKAEMYRDQAMEAAGMRGLGITMLANKRVNQQQIENAELEGRPAVTPRYNAERVAPVLKAAAERTADVGAVDGTTGAGSVAQGSSDTEAERSASASVTRNNLGVFTYTATRGTGALLRGEEPQDLKSRGDWPGTQLVRTDAADDGTNRAGMTYANVYTDIQAPTQAYATAATTFTPGTSGATAPTTSMIVAGEVADDGSNFAATLNVNPTDNMAPIDGQFQCPAATACSISVNARGQIVHSVGYTFHVETGIAAPDPDYLAWGVWLTVPGEVIATGEFPTGATTAGTFASGSDVFEVNAALKGKATYNGVATGLYSAGGMVENFDADVMLEANFGSIVGADSDPDTAGNNGLLLGAVTGTVSNINAGGMAVDGSLALLRAPVVTATAGTPSTGGFTGSTDGILGGVTYRGAWGGQFYGPNRATGTAMQNEFPTTAAGTFGAAAENGASLLGAFGSWMPQ